MHEIKELPADWLTGLNVATQVSVFCSYPLLLLSSDHLLISDVTYLSTQPNHTYPIDIPFQRLNVDCMCYVVPDLFSSVPHLKQQVQRGLRGGSRYVGGQWLDYPY